MKRETAAVLALTAAFAAAALNAADVQGPRDPGAFRTATPAPKSLAAWRGELRRLSVSPEPDPAALRSLITAMPPLPPEAARAQRRAGFPGRPADPGKAALDEPIKEQLEPR